MIMRQPVGLGHRSSGAAAALYAGRRVASVTVTSGTLASAGPIFFSGCIQPLLQLILQDLLLVFHLNSPRMYALLALQCSSRNFNSVGHYIPNSLGCPSPPCDLSFGCLRVD
jgi:hypothetical protein